MLVQGKFASSFGILQVTEIATWMHSNTAIKFPLTCHVNTLLRLRVLCLHSVEEEDSSRGVKKLEWIVLFSSFLKPFWCLAGCQSAGQDRFGAIARVRRIIRDSHYVYCFGVGLLCVCHDVSLRCCLLILVRDFIFQFASGCDVCLLGCLNPIAIKERVKILA